MRIALVSAHYPPNFVSGGTLVPQRIADGLAARGHEVHVFAGELDAGRPDLWTRTETTETGVRVHWVATTSFIGWADPRNYDNPGVESTFREFLERVRPDVVHLHSLQGMGAGLVSLARAAGAATVVTMHDMWWWCSRQFQATPGMQACNPVQDCGLCGCEAGRGFMDVRQERLATHLNAAHLVLAPSPGMKRRLIAGGVRADRVELDENPAPQGILEPPPRTEDPGTVRFVFAGGSHPLKGGNLTVAAARSLADLPGWSLDMYGYDPAANYAFVPQAPFAGAAPPEGGPVRLLPPYESDDTSDILSRYDVLLMTSVATESYSLITREALAGGLAVVSFDNPGPGEVVHDGVNGLIVPRGSVEGLAGAMRSLVTDRTLLDRLRPTPGAIALRTLDDQLDGLEEQFGRLAAEIREPHPAPPAAPIQQVLLVTGIGSAPLRYRGHLPAEALAGVGIRMDIRHYLDVEVPALARTADAVVFYRVPATLQTLDVISMVRSRPEPVPVLYDIDDLVFDPGLADELNPKLAKVEGLDIDLYWQGIRRYRTTLEACDGYIGSTRMLCDRVEELTGMPTYRFHNGVGRRLAQVSEQELDRPRLPGPVRIGYFSGTNTHNEDWAFIEPAVAAVLAAHPKVELWIGGLLEYSSRLDEFAGRIRRLPLLPWQELPGLLRDVDVNLAPLVPGSMFNDAKSAIKWLEAALVGTVTIATATEPFREAVRDGETGLLVQTEEEWIGALERLVIDPLLRHRIGSRAREEALLSLSPRAQGHRYAAILAEARDRVATHGHRPESGWPVEAPSEPWVLAPVDGYGEVDLLPTGGSGRRSLGLIALEYRRNAVRHLNEHGPAATARKTIDVLGRTPARVLHRIRGDR